MGGVGDDATLTASLIAGQIQGRLFRSAFLPNRSAASAANTDARSCPIAWNMLATPLPRDRDSSPPTPSKFPA